MVDDEIFKKVSNLILLTLVSLTIGLCVRHTYAEEIPPLPDKAKNIAPLNNNFELALGSGVRYLDDGRVLQMSSACSQSGAIWSKTKVDLSKPFTLKGYIYLGNQGEKAGDGLTFCMQTEGKSYIGDIGKGIGAYRDGVEDKVLALEFDTFFNINETDGDGDGSCGLSAPTNHIAFCKAETNWEKGQKHQGVSQLQKKIPGIQKEEYLSNGYWKELEVSGKPIDKNRTMLTYKVRDLKDSKIYSNSFELMFDGTDSISENYCFGTNEVYWGFTSSTGASWETSAVAFDSLPQAALINVRDVTIFQGESWNPSQNLIWAKDEEGRPMTLEDWRLTSTNNVKTNTPGTYEVTYNYQSADGGYTQTAKAKVTVLGDPTIHTQNTTLYVGEKWNPAANFVSAADEAENSVPWGDPRIDINGATVDTTKPGVTHLKYTIKGKKKTVASSFTVTVLENKTSLCTRDTTLKEGQKWNPAVNFVSATDEAGNSVPWGDPRIDINGATVDTKHSGTTQLKYTMRGKGKNVDSSFTVTVTPPVQLSVPATCDFGTYRLGDSNPVLPWKKSSKVEVKGNLGAQWQLSVSLNSGSSLKGYLKLGNKTLSEQSQKVINGSGSMNISDGFSSDDFIKVDYTGVKQTRKDTGVLEWTLTPSTKKVRE